LEDSGGAGVRQAGDEKLVDEWALVLLAQGLSPRVRRRRDGVVLSVPQDQLERARAVLSAYESENPKKPAESIEPAHIAGSVVGSAVVGILILPFLVITNISKATVSWFDRGSYEPNRTNSTTTGF
jgi:hypothetical protein